MINKNAAKIRTGHPAPDFTLPGLDGKVVRLRSLAGKKGITVIDFWNR